MLTKSENLVATLTRVGLAFVFMYAGIGALVQPAAWIAFFPSWIQGVLPTSLLLIYFAVFQITLAVWIISAKKAFHASIVAAITLLLIISANIRNFDIVFRDVEIFISALALAALAKKDMDIEHAHTEEKK
jgi:uncharacterized membrane protein YphA (DoxX/SURF4 family)